MPQNAFFLRTCDLLVSPKTTQRHFFFSTLHPLSTVIFATATVLAFILLRDPRFNFHCYTQREATRPTQKSARKCAATSPAATSCATKKYKAASIHSSKPGGGDSSVVRAPDSWLKGRGFESLLERRENFLLQGRLSVLTLISVSVPPPCYHSST